MSHVLKTPLTPEQVITAADRVISEEEYRGLLRTLEPLLDGLGVREPQERVFAAEMLIRGIVIGRCEIRREDA